MNRLENSPYNQAKVRAACRLSRFSLARAQYKAIIKLYIEKSAHFSASFFLNNVPQLSTSAAEVANEQPTSTPPMNNNNYEPVFQPPRTFGIFDANILRRFSSSKILALLRGFAGTSVYELVKHFEATSVNCDTSISSAVANCDASVSSAANCNESVSSAVDGDGGAAFASASRHSSTSSPSSSLIDTEPPTVDEARRSSSGCPSSLIDAEPTADEVRFAAFLKYSARLSR